MVHRPGGVGGAGLRRLLRTSLPRTRVNRPGRSDLRPSRGGRLGAMGMENVYGCCPMCGANDGYLDVGEEQWFYCSAHKKRAGRLVPALGVAS